jgi:hypothetical protein
MKFQEKRLVAVEQFDSVVFIRVSNSDRFNFVPKRIEKFRF